MLKMTLIAIVAAVAAVLVFAATRPDTFSVRRSATINAPPEKIFPLINDLRRFNTWNPFEKKDPRVKGSYSGPATGKGAAYAFEGNRDVGKGTIEITDAAPASRVTMNLHMREPFEARNVVEFTLEPQGDATTVTWNMRGHTPYLAKLVGLVFDMDSMVGKDFEAGLAGLKSIVERPVREAS